MYIYERVILTSNSSGTTSTYFEMVLYNSVCIFSKVSGVQFTRSETSNAFILSFATETEEVPFFVSNTFIPVILLLATEKFSKESGMFIQIQKRDFFPDNTLTDIAVSRA